MNNCEQSHHSLLTLRLHYLLMITLLVLPLLEEFKLASKEVTSQFLDNNVCCFGFIDFHLVLVNLSCVFPSQETFLSPGIQHLMYYLSKDFFLGYFIFIVVG